MAAKAAAAARCWECSRVGASLCCGFALCAPGCSCGVATVGGCRKAGAAVAAAVKAPVRDSPIGAGRESSVAAAAAMSAAAVETVHTAGQAAVSAAAAAASGSADAAGVAADSWAAVLHCQLLPLALPLPLQRLQAGAQVFLLQSRCGRKHRLCHSGSCQLPSILLLLRSRRHALQPSSALQPLLLEAQLAAAVGHLQWPPPLRGVREPQAAAGLPALLQGPGRCRVASPAAARLLRPEAPVPRANRWRTCCPAAQPAALPCETRRWQLPLLLPARAPPLPT